MLSADTYAGKPSMVALAVAVGSHWRGFHSICRSDFALNADKGKHHRARYYSCYPWPVNLWCSNTLRMPSRKATHTRFLPEELLNAGWRLHFDRVTQQIEEQLSTCKL